MLSILSCFIPGKFLLRAVLHRSHIQGLIHGTRVSTCNWEVIYKQNHLQFNNGARLYRNQQLHRKKSCCLTFPPKCTKPPPLSSACIVKIHSQEVRNLFQIQLSQKQENSVSPLSKDTSVCVCVCVW